MRPADVTPGSADPGGWTSRSAGGDEQRHLFAAILEHDVSESPSFVDARMPFDDMGHAGSRHDVIRRKCLKDAIRSAVTLCRFFERDRAFGEPELQRTVAMIADRRSRERRCRRDPVAAAIPETKGRSEQERRSQRPPSAEPAPADRRYVGGSLPETCLQLCHEFRRWVEFG